VGLDGGDPAVWVTATVDVEDTDDVVDVFVDRLIDLQIEHGLALHVMTVQTPERTAAAREARRAAQAIPA